MKCSTCHKQQEFNALKDTRQTVLVQRAIKHLDCVSSFTAALNMYL